MRLRVQGARATDNVPATIISRTLEGVDNLAFGRAAARGGATLNSTERAALYNALAAYRAAVGF